MSTLSVTVLLLIAYFGISLYTVKNIVLHAKDLAICGIIIALTLILDFIRIPLLTGATMSLCSPVPLLMLAILWSPKLAIVSGWVCGILALFLVPAWQPVHWGQIFAEHLVCFSALGYAGSFGNDKRWKVLCGILLASVIKICGHTLSGVLFFSQNAWDGWGAWGYSLAYNFSQNIPLCLLSGAIIMVLPLGSLKHAIGKERSL